jgi:DNA-binding transcriptional LysR family regulator
MNLSLERVLRFVVVAEHMSFTRAAAALGIDQPWLSRQVMQLEEQLGFTLFERGGSRISLTREGEIFLTAAKELGVSVEKVRNLAEEMNRSNLALLRIGVAGSTYPVEGRHRLLEAYAKIRPQVQVELSAYETTDEVAERVEAGDLEFGIVFEPVFAPDVQICVLEPVEQTLAVPQEDPLARAPSIALADLAGRKVANSARDATHQRYRYAYGWVEEVGASVRSVIEGRRFLPMVAEKERLIFVCYTPGDVVPASFVRRPIHGPKPYLSLCLIRGRRVLSAAGERLWRLGQEVGAEQRIAS